jgi:hypothetical protein
MMATGTAITWAATCGGKITWRINVRRIQLLRNLWKKRCLLGVIYFLRIIAGGF